MADTRRTKAQILALLADNTSGAISPQDLRDAIVSMFGGFASTWVEDGVTAMAVNATPSKMTAFNLSGSTSMNGLTVSADRDSITIDVDGTYLVNFSCSFTGTVSKTFEFELFVNGTAQTRKATATRSGTSGQDSHVSINAIFPLVANDVVTVYISSIDGGTSVTPINAQLSITQVA